MNLRAIESTQGRHLDLAAHAGKTLVIFYEGRGHTDDNAELKESCGRLVERGSFGRRFDVLGVADVEGLGRGPVGAVVRAAVRAVAAHHGIELWLDFGGTLKQAPFCLDGGRGSTVAIVDGRGEVVYRAHGRLDPVELDRFFAALARALEDKAVVDIGESLRRAPALAR